MKKLVSVCVFLLALVTGVFAMAREPVYGVLFIPKKEYTLEKGKFRATVPQVQAVSFIDGRTPVNECGAGKDSTSPSSMHSFIPSCINSASALESILENPSALIYKFIYYF